MDTDGHPAIDAAWHEVALAEAERAARRAGRQSDLVALARFLVLAATVAAAASVAAAPGAGPIIGTGLAVGLWLALALVHGSVIDRRDSLRRRAAWHRDGVDRCHDRWRARDPAGAVAASHPFAHDLDCIGPHGLLARLDTAGSQRGTRALADLLLDPGTDWSPQRRASVRALAERHGWRARLAVDAAPRRRDDAGDPALLAWLEDAPEPWPAWVGPLALVAGLGISLAAVAVFLLLPVGLAVIALVLLVVIGAGVNSRALASTAVTVDPDRELGRVAALKGGLAAVAAVVHEADAGHDPACRRLASAAEASARGLGQLEALAAGLARRRNPLWTMGLGALSLAELRLAARLRRWAAEHRDEAPGWLEVLGEAEALACLATWAAEQPGCWPTVQDAGALFAAEGLAHPLLPRADRVANDGAIADGQLLLLTGANASGKSTWLRTIGLAVLLARAGTTVPARSLRLRPLRLATVMRVHDDLAAGQSRFQAEVARLAQALEVARSPGAPVLLIFDEILGGTNSRERHLGTRAILHERLGRPGAILVATHDLDLPALAAEAPQAVVLAHFADRADSADLVFDYRLRPGVIETTNALRVMRAAGLPIRDDQG